MKSKFHICKFGSRHPVCVSWLAKALIYVGGELPKGFTSSEPESSLWSPRFKLFAFVQIKDWIILTKLKECKENVSRLGNTRMRMRIFGNTCEQSLHLRLALHTKRHWRGGRHIWGQNCPASQFLGIFWADLWGGIFSFCRRRFHLKLNALAPITEGRKRHSALPLNIEEVPSSCCQLSWWW